MLAEDRFLRIIDMVESKGSVTISELMTELDASESTIRRALNQLDANGMLTKVHGGAIRKGTTFSSEDNEVSMRMELNIDKKRIIAEYAATLIEAGDFVYIDAGTTTELLVDYITERKAEFVTNAIVHAKKLAAKGMKVYLLGGEIKSVTEAIVGEEAVRGLSKYNFTKGFFGTNGVDMEKGFFTPDVKEAMVKSSAIEQCRQAYVLADESKFNQISNVTFAEFSSAKVITTGLKSKQYKKCMNIIEV